MLLLYYLLIICKSIDGDTIVQPLLCKTLCAEILAPLDGESSNNSIAIGIMLQSGKCSRIIFWAPGNAWSAGAKLIGSKEIGCTLSRC